MAATSSFFTAYVLCSYIRTPTHTCGHVWSAVRAWLSRVTMYWWLCPDIMRSRARVISARERIMSGHETGGFTASDLCRYEEGSPSILQ